MKRIIFLCLFFPAVLHAQKGKNGALAVSTPIEVNEYTALTANALAGNTSITVANSSLNAHARFLAPLAAGDLVMIIQMQGASINGKPDPFNPSISTPNDSSWGAVTNYNNCGNNEIREVLSVPNGTTINLSCPLANSYADTGKVQVVRIPRLLSLTINLGGTLGCDAWDSVVGGIIAIEIENNTVINSGGQINASSDGFRGGFLLNSSAIATGVTYFASNQPTVNGAYKGEGIAGNGNDYNKYGGAVGRGAPANGGGGGDSWNGGGGGGANAGVVSNWKNGFGIPDTSSPGYITAWNLEYSWLAHFSCSGGGRGGYTWCNAGPNPLVRGPGFAGYGGDDRRSVGGRGGRPLDYSTGKLFLGGGGGCGSEDNNDGGNGGSGGGMIYLVSYGTVSGSGMVVANGQNGVTDTLVPGDGPGGAGAGGTIIINSTGAISGITMEANGANGGGQTIHTGEGEGPGGGGSGGYIATTNIATEQVNGGVNGTTLTFPTFPPNGGTKGAAGLTSIIPVSTGSISVSDTFLCPGDSVHFFGAAPLYSNGGAITWAWTFTGGSPSASSLQNPTVSYTSSGTYTVRLIETTCAGIDTITKNINVTITNLAISITGLDSICPGQTDSLKANAVGAISYTWTGGVSCPTCKATSVSPLTTTTYSLSVSNGTCTRDTTFTVNIKPVPVPSITVHPDTICVGDSTQLTGGGGNSYFWPVPGSSNNPIWVKPITTTTYTVQVSKSGCTSSISKQVVVLTNPVTKLILRQDSICSSDSTYLVASGGTNYKWSPGGATTDSIKVKPASTTTYSVIITEPCGKDTLSKTLHILQFPVVTTSGSTIICKGSNATISASGGTSYVWLPGGSTASTINVSPGTTTTYTVAVSNGKCIKDTTITVTVNPPPTVTITPPLLLCINDSTILTATGGGTYKWSNGATTSSITVKPLTTTSYTCVVSNGCLDSASTTVTLDIPVLNACCDETISPGGADTITANSATNYLWSPNLFLSCDTCATIIATPSVTTTYTVLTKDNHGCFVERTVTVIVEIPCADFNVPNIFTPNNDGRNDDFVINILNPATYAINIYDRWGKEVYTSTDPTVYWNGKLLNTAYLVSDGVYYYIIKATCGSNDYVKKGFVQVVGGN